MSENKPLFNKPLFFQGAYAPRNVERKKWPSDLEIAELEEKFLIRYGESPQSNPVCRCVQPEIAKEMAELLNMGIKMREKGDKR